MLRSVRSSVRLSHTQSSKRCILGLWLLYNYNTIGNVILEVKPNGQRGRTVYQDDGSLSYGLNVFLTTAIVTLIVSLGENWVKFMDCCQIQHNFKCNKYF